METYPDDVLENGFSHGFIIRSSGGKVILHARPCPSARDRGYRIKTSKIQIGSVVTRYVVDRFGSVINSGDYVVAGTSE